MKNINDLLVKVNQTIDDAIKVLDKYGFGICLIIDSDNKLVGTVTDGDIRRKILKVQKPFSALLNDDIIKHINIKPTKININQTLSTALALMKKKLIWDLPAVDKDNKLIGMLHLHPIVKLLLKK